MGRFQDILGCSACYAGIDMFDEFIQTRTFLDPVEYMCTLVCATTLDYHSCEMFVKNNEPLIMEALLGYNLKDDFFCEKILPICDTNYYTEDKPQDYIKKILADKPKELEKDDFVNNLYEKINKDTNERKTFKMLHIADAHLDFQYQVGDDIDCDWVICCRDETGKTVDPTKEAKPWGSYTCDLPKKTLVNMGDFVNENIKPDVVMWTGDTPPHDQWHYTADEIRNYTSYMSGFLHEKLKDYPIFPVEGNHDFTQINSEDFHKPDPMLDFMANLWTDYLTDDAMKTFKEYGYYVMPLRLVDGTEVPKTKMIALNTQSCYTMNLLLWMNRDDPANELSWLEAQLKEMEANGENAIIYGHVPPGDDCMYNWAIRFKALMERY